MPSADSIEPRRFPAEDCPDAEGLAGFAERRLLPVERRVVEGHLGGCPSCASTVATLVRDGRVVRAERPMRFPWRRARVSPVAAAAGLALAIGLALAAPPLLRRLRGERGTEDAGALLVASAEALARSRPDLFGGFRPLDRSERLAPGLEAHRGGFRAVYPADRILEDRPAFRWESPAGAASFRVVVFGEDGRAVASGETDRAGLERLEGGPLVPGRYVWEVTATGPFGAETARRAFEVPDARDRRALEAAMREIEDRVEAPVRSLVQAHFAIRRGYLGEAERHARAFAGARPADPVGAETLGRVLALLGAPGPEPR